MVDGNVNIQITADGSQAKSELTGVAEAEKAVTAATTEQGAAFTETAAEAEALDRAQAKLAGTQTATAAASGELRDAVTGLTIAEVEAGVQGENVNLTLLAQEKAQADLAVATGMTAAEQAAAAATAAAEAVAEEEDAAATLAAAEAKKAATAATKSLNTEATLARGNIGGLARAVASMGGDFAGAVLPMFIAIEALKLLPQLYKLVDDATKSLSESIANNIYNLEEETAAEDKANAAAAKHDATIKQQQDTREQFAQAQVAMVAGILDETNDVLAAVAAWQGHHAAITGNFEQYPAFIAALKAMGVTFKETHEQMTNEAQLFAQAYQTVLVKDGIAGANAWGEANKSVLDKIVAYYQQAKIVIPKALSDIVEAIEGDAKRMAAAAEQLKLADLAKQYDTLEETVVTDIEKMRAARDADIASVENRANRTINSIHDEEDALQKQWQQGVIGQQAYRTAMDGLIEQETNVVADSTAEKEKLNQSEAESEKKKSDDWAAASAKIKAAIEAEGSTFDAAQFALSGYNLAQQDVLQAQKDQLTTVLASATPHATLNAIIKDGTAQYHDIHAAIAMTTKQTNEYAKAASYVPKVHVAIARSSPFKKSAG